jgi:hypothetical protein
VLRCIADEDGRLILYYPVSALVTLFANILQNPQDARARSDLRLMASVVNFLKMLERDISEQNNNIRRMLAVCVEFERIASIVLTKAEKDRINGRSASKRKAAGGNITERKEVERVMRERGVTEAAIAAALEEGKTLEQMQVETQAPYRRPVATPSLKASMARSQAGSQASDSPASWAGSQAGGTGAEYRSPGPPQAQQLSQQRTPAFPGVELELPALTGHWPPGESPPMGQAPQPPPQRTNPGPPPPFSQPLATGPDGFVGQTPLTTTGFSPPDPLIAGDFGTGLNGFDPTSPGMGSRVAGVAGSFQQPFVPQDLWQMPMTLEWDWAEGLGLGAFTPGGGGGGMGGFDGGVGPPPGSAPGNFMHQRGG